VTTITATATDSQPASKQCQFTVTINYTPPPPPSVDISVSPTTTTTGSSVTVSYSNPNPTSTDWIALSPAGPSLQTYSDWKYAGSCTRTPGAAIASGSCPFTVPSTPGTYEFWLLANNQYTVLDTVTVTVTSSTPPPPPPSTGVGPQPTITCPAGAVDIVPGPGTTIPYIQSLIDNYPGTTTFCFRAGVVTVDRSITPKTGNTFVGEYGAILDGTGWTTTDDSMAAFRAHNQDIDFVTIRNLVIRNLRRGINAYGTLPDHWTIDHNEIGPNYSGVVFSSYSLVTNNNIHHSSYIGYFGDHADYSTIENNEIAYNGWDQKVATSVNVTFRNNFIHHNSGGGIWYDSDNTGALVEGNRVEDNGWIGIFYEISGDGIIRNNTIRRNGDAGVFLGTSKNTQIYNNTFENNFRGITFFVNCAVVGGGTLPGGYDLVNNTAHDNTITVGTQSGVFASSFSYYGVCTPTQTAPYLNGSKNLTFSNNTYHVPLPATGQYWLWGETFKYWNEWQAIPQDLTSTVSQ